MQTDIHFSTGTLAGYAVSGVLFIVLPLIIAFFWRRYTHESWVVFIAGALIYYAAGTVRLMLRMLIFQEGSTLSSDPFWFYLVQGLLSGVLEETARYLAFKYPLKNRTERTVAVMYGLGHDWTESAAAGGILSFHYVLDGIDWNNLGAEEFTRGLDDKAAHSMLEGVAELAGRSFPDMLLVNLDSLGGTAAHVALSVIVFKAVQTGNWKRWLLTAIGLHAMSNFLRGYIPLPETPMRLFSLAISAAICFYGYRIYKSLPYA